MENSQCNKQLRPGSGAVSGGSQPSAARTSRFVGAQQKTYFKLPTTPRCPRRNCWPQRDCVVASAGHRSIQNSTKDCA
jgi:hypothetical protein